MANYTTVDGYKFDAQVNYGWGLTLNMTGKAPEVSKRIFDTYQHMLYYVNDYNDSCIEGLTLKVMADGEKNGVYFVAKIGTEGADKAFANDGEVIKLASEGKVSGDVQELQEALDAEIAARKAVDGQTGQTYAANGSANYINSATSLNDADVKLDAQVKVNADAIDALEGLMGEQSVATQITNAINDLDATVSSQTDNVSVTIVQTDGKLTSVTLSQTDIASASALTQEISDREDAIEAEASARTAADDAITSAYTEAIANEASARTDADNAITSAYTEAIANEASARTAADNAITSAYTAADQALQNAIDAAVAAAISVIAKDDSIVITSNAETATLKEFKVGDIDCGTF